MELYLKGGIMPAMKNDPKLQKAILLISPNFTPEPTGIGKVNGEMINWFAKNGFSCDVITAFPYYPQWRIQPPYKNRWFKKEKISVAEANSSISVYRCPFYIPAHPSGLRRIAQDFSYWLSMPWIALKFILARKKFDLIVTIAPPFHLGRVGLLIKKRTSAKLLY